MLKSCRIAFCSQNENKRYETLLLKNEIQTEQVASFSVILSAAAYLLHHFPQLPHPHRSQIKLPHNRQDKDYPSIYLSLHPLLDEWTTVLVSCILQRNGLRQGDTLYLKVSVSRQVADYLKKIQFPLQQSESDRSVKQIFNLKSNFSQKRICWLSCSTALINKKMFVPTMQTYAMFLGQVYNNQLYDVFTILKEQKIPSIQQLLKYDTLIIPGSGLSVLDANQKIEKLSHNVLEAYKKSDKLKILGICYGHQFMAKLFGAKIVKRQRYGGLETIQFKKQVINKFSFLEPLKIYNEPNIRLSEHHEDNVTTIPQGYIQLAVSKSCQNEGFISQNGRIMSFQFHPEYNYVFAKGYTARLDVYYNDGIKDKPIYNHNKQTLEEHYKACHVIRDCMARFI